jgi:hypothetical protein
VRSRDDIHQSGAARIADVHPPEVPIDPPRRPLTALARRIRTDWSMLIDEPVAVLRARGPLAFPFATAATLMVFVLWLGTLTDATWRIVMWTSGVYHALPFGLVVLRLPLSLFAPAPELPVWGALAQVFATFMLCEHWLGWWRTFLAAEFVTATTTLVAHVMVLIGLQLSIGLPEVDAYELDTGPSTAVVALAVYVGLRRRTYVAVAIVVAMMAGEEIVLPNLAGREHLVAIALGFITYGFVEHVWPRIRRPPRTNHPPTAEQPPRTEQPSV